MEIIIALAVLGNLWWSWRNYCDHHDRLKLYKLMDASTESLKAQADMVLRKAQKLLHAAKNRLEYKVCSDCGKIKDQYVTDIRGEIVCVECEAAKMARAV